MGGGEAFGFGGEGEPPRHMLLSLQLRLHLLFENSLEEPHDFPTARLEPDLTIGP
jgi:hypothetical protein